MSNALSKPSEFQTLLDYAERFRDRAKGQMAIGEFRAYVRNLTEDISELNDSESMAQIQAALGELSRCDYALRNSPEMKQEIVVPAIEKLVVAIRARVELAS